METIFEEERRDRQRLNFRFPIRYHLLPNSRDFTKHRRPVAGVLTRDIGEGGLRFVSERFIPRFAGLLIESSPLSPYWRIKAKVCWVQRVSYSEKYNIGLSFQNGEEHSKKILSLYSE